MMCVKQKYYYILMCCITIHKPSTTNYAYKCDNVLCVEQMGLRLKAMPDFQPCRFHGRHILEA